MSFGDDPDVLAAKRWLQRRLEDAFTVTAAKCCHALEKCSINYSGYNPYLSDAVLAWRLQSLATVREGFEAILGAIIRTKQYSGVRIQETVSEITWEAIEGFFGWTAEDKTDSAKFKAWIERSGVRICSVDVQLFSPECATQMSLDARLNCDFHKQFERVIDELTTHIISHPEKISEVPSTSDLATPQDIFRYNDDYTSITMGGTNYGLTPNRAKIIETLHKAYLKNLPGCSTRQLLIGIQAPKGRLRDSFRSGEGPRVWKELITNVRKGFYALRFPPQ
jgi:hypothetical protein